MIGSGIRIKKIELEPIFARMKEKLNAGKIQCTRSGSFLAPGSESIIICTEPDSPSTSQKI
jgi:hypothetical protein